MVDKTYKANRQLSPEPRIPRDINQPTSKAKIKGKDPSSVFDELGGEPYQRDNYHIVVRFD